MGLPTTPWASSAFGPTGESIFMFSSPSGPHYPGQHAMQGSPRQRYLEVVAAESPRALKNRVGRCVEGGCVRRGIDQRLFCPRRSPGFGFQSAEREPSRAYPSMYAVDDRGDRDQGEGVRGAIADL